MRNGGSIITYAACKHCLRELVVEKMITLLTTIASIDCSRFHLTHQFVTTVNTQQTS